jgi:hypothetical protein
MVLALNTVSGQIADVSPKMLLHPKFRDILVPVDQNAKPYNSAMYKPGTVEEKIEQHSTPGIFSFKKKEKVEEEEELLTIEEVFEHLDEVEAQEPESNIDIEEEN